MKLQQRIELIKKLAIFLQENTDDFRQAKKEASVRNGWFIPEFIDLSVQNICQHLLREDLLAGWVRHYRLDDQIQPRKIGIAMAGNIPLVGFHDFLCVFISGHDPVIKLSSKDDVLLPYFISKMTESEPSIAADIQFAPILTGCDAYIATGNNNSARYFEYYFSRYPSIIRHNRTSVAILSGRETTEELDRLSDDIHLYFGLGCRNVTKIYVPEAYDFVPLIRAFDRYGYFGDHHKYKNNYDYYLSIQIMNNRFYMTNGSTLLMESESFFSPISQLNYAYYTDRSALLSELAVNPDIQCIVGEGIPFGNAQAPGLSDYADGVDTLQFLLGI